MWCACRRGIASVPGPLRVTRGPFTGFAGLYVGMSGRQRVELLLTLPGGQTRVMLPKGDIELVSGP